MQTTIEKVKQGHLFTLKDSETAPLFVRGEFNRIDGYNRYLCSAWDTYHAEKHLKKGTTVYIN